MGISGKLVLSRVKHGKTINITIWEKISLQVLTIDVLVLYHFPELTSKLDWVNQCPVKQFLFVVEVVLGANVILDSALQILRLKWLNRVQFLLVIFAGRGMPAVSNAHAASWGAFGLVPGMPNGGMDALHPLGLQGTFRSAINPTLSMGIPRQRCRDFEERGFCLRGDMCPMEHGVNRIVVEDVQVCYAVVLCLGINFLLLTFISLKFGKIRGEGGLIMGGYSLVRYSTC